jgi:hypothetical protein
MVPALLHYSGIVTCAIQHLLRGGKCYTEVVYRSRSDLERADQSTHILTPFRFMARFSEGRSTKLYILNLGATSSHGEQRYVE